MSSPTNPTSSGNQDDPWEQLAEDLFGLEYGKEHGLRESSPPAIEPVAPAVTPSHSVSVEDRPVPASVTSPAAAEPQHRHDEPAFAAGPAFKEPETSQVPESSQEPESSQDTGETSSPAAAETGSPQDSYWDALANWNWDESDGAASKAKSEPPRSSGGPPPRGGPRGRDDRRDRRGGEKPQRQASGSSQPGSSPPAAASPSAASPPHSSIPRSSTPHSSTPPASAPRSPRPAGAAAGDDFGLGVADSEAAFSAPQESRTTEDRGASGPRRPVHRDAASRAESSKPAPAAGRGEHRPGSGERGAEPGSGKEEEGEFPRKRRRRRRRRARGGEPGATPGAATAPASSTSGDECDDSAGPESDAAVDEPQTPVADSREETKDAFEGDRHAPARGRRHGPRHERTRPERTRPEGTAHRSNAARSTADSSDVPRSLERLDDGPGELEEEPLLVGGGVEESAGADDGEDDAGEQAVSYENVPTWEEAISYLLHPNQVQVEPGAGNGSASPRQAPPTDQPRQTRHMGSQGHRG